MSLSSHQVILIQQSFKKVAPIADVAAKIFYDKLFEYDPQLQRLFKNNMGEQGKKLMQTLGVAVGALKTLDKVVPIIQNLAVKHLDYGVKVDDYTPVGNALIYTLGQGLGSAFTAELKQAWSTLLKVIFDVMRAAAYPNFNAATYKNHKHYTH
ncbi:MAG: hemin receptor [Saccharospirillaceae bacterium]|nr:globin domain-containing protein [Pseudomonadales bacterium]NRB78468.1 hemin receptor [Saccharospirillaceae bacterium]